MVCHRIAVIVLLVASALGWLAAGVARPGAASPAPTRAASPPAATPAAEAACRTTAPDQPVPADEGRGVGWYGNDALSTNVWMWDDWEGGSRVPVPASHVLPDGAFGEMKWAWYRYAPGTLTIAGRRLDAAAPPLRAWIPEGYGDRGFQVSGLIFPTGGCWEVEGRVGGASLTFVTLVIPPAGEPGSNATPVTAADGATCWVTAPNGAQPPGGEHVFGRGPGGHGDGRLWTNVWIWGEGEVVVPATHVQPGGALGPMKWGWWRGVRGRLAITGRRLDAAAPPLRAETGGGERLDAPAPTPRPGNRITYSPSAFHPTGLIFPTPGCWEITGRVGDASLTFVTLVVAPAPTEGA